jgi:hypothetical protein
MRSFITHVLPVQNAETSKAKYPALRSRRRHSHAQALCPVIAFAPVTASPVARRSAEALTEGATFARRPAEINHNTIFSAPTQSKL